MKISIIAIGIAVIGGIALMSVKDDPTIQGPDISNLDVKRLSAPDSVSHWEIKQIVERNLVARLEGQGGIKASWSYMDKSGHRSMVFDNVDYQFKNTDKYWIKVSEDGEVFGDVIRLDGSFRSHLCSFKLVYPDMELYARKSVLDEWQDVISFTGVEEVPVMRQNEWDTIDLEPLEADSTGLE